MAAPHTALFEQVERQGNGLVGTVTGYRHDAGIQRFQLRPDGFTVIGQRRHRKRCPGIGQQGSLAFQALIQNVADLVTRPFQPAGRHVVGIHGEREVQGDNQGILRSEHGLRQFVPGRARQRDNAQQPARHGQYYRRAPRPAGSPDQNVRQQAFVDYRFPVAVRPFSEKHEPGQQRQRQQGDEPLRP